jgi:regulator of nucleoside diphosphate kinase
MEEYSPEMMINVRRESGEVSDAVREFTRRRVAHALQSREGVVSDVDVSIMDSPRPAGGTGVECTVTVRVSSGGEPLDLAGSGSDTYAAILDATAHLEEAVSRALAQKPPIERSGGSPRTISDRSDGTAIAAGDEIVVTAQDRDRLRRLVQTRGEGPDREAAQALADELDRAIIVSSERVAGDVVTMNSRVVFEDEATGESREVSLVYPQDSDPTQGRISVVAPVGTALLGLSAGQTIDWPLPHGQFRRYRVVKIVHQPEAAGD